MPWAEATHGMASEDQGLGLAEASLAWLSSQVRGRILTLAWTWTDAARQRRNCVCLASVGQHRGREGAKRSLRRSAHSQGDTQTWLHVPVVVVAAFAVVCTVAPCVSPSVVV